MRLRRLAGMTTAACVAGCTAITGAADLTVDDTFELRDGGRGDDVAPPTPPPPPGEGGPGPVDAGDGAASCPAFAVFCDDFESGSLSKWTTLFQTNGGQVSIADTPVHGGAHAMHAHAPKHEPIDGSYPSIGAGARVTVPVVASGLFVVRAWVYLPAKLASETTFLKVFAKNGVDDMNVKVDPDGNILVDTDTPGSGPDIVSAKPAPVGRWFCIEWQATVGAIGHQRVDVDGEKILDAPENTATTEGYDSVQPGFNASNGSLTQDVFADDVVVATQPIGCL